MWIYEFWWAPNCHRVDSVHSRTCAHITVTPTNGLATNETGGQATFDVVIDTLPSADVTIDISSDDTSEGTVDKSSLTFTPANWETAQTVTVTGVDDVDVDGNVVYTIVTAVATSADADYNGLDADDVVVTNQDDEQPPSTTNDSADTPTNIPDRGMADSTITVTDAFQINNLTVTLNITHQRPSDLDVYLVGPNDVVQLFNLSGDNNVGDFNGISTAGSWTIEVYDTRKKKTGTLNAWSMTVDY